MPPGGAVGGAPRNGTTGAEGAGAAAAGAAGAAEAAGAAGAAAGAGLGVGSVKKKPAKGKTKRKDFSQRALNIVERVTGAKPLKPKRKSNGSG